MTFAELEGSVLEMKGKIKENWGHLTDNDWKVLEGEFEQFVGKLKKKLAADKDLADVKIEGPK